MLSLLIGFQGSTKSTYAASLAANDPNAAIVSRDAYGGKISDLVPHAKKHLQENKHVILDNTHLTKESRKLFIELAKELDKPITATHIDSPIEDCQIRILHRMYMTHDDIFFTGKDKKAANDPHVFPISVLFAARKNFEAPTAAEGFTHIKKIKVDSPKFTKEDGYVNKALFLDIDGTIRETEHLDNKYPTNPTECVLIKDRAQMRKKLDKYIADGYQLIGVSNQSGVSKGILTEKTADACFNKTRELLGYTEEEFPILYCPHKSVPISCYCRKPQSGIGVWAIENYRLAPSSCIMVGDRGTDKSFAERLGISFIEASKFWN